MMRLDGWMIEDCEGSVLWIESRTWIPKQEGRLVARWDREIRSFQIGCE